MVLGEWFGPRRLWGPKGPVELNGTIVEPQGAVITHENRRDSFPCRLGTRGGDYRRSRALDSSSGCRSNSFVFIIISKKF